MAEKHYDLLVVGAGSGLDVAVATADHFGWKVALVEKGPLGGTCLNRGCIPSKMIIHAADVAETIREGGKLGIHGRIERIDFAAVMRRANDHVDGEAAEIERNVRQHPAIDLYKSTGYFSAPKKMVTEAGDSIIAKRVLIAAGARPLRKPIEGLAAVDYWTSAEALRQTRQPASLLIIGGGFVCAEMAHFYGALGTRVTIVQHSDRLLRGEDQDISAAFTRAFSAKHTILLNSEVSSVRQESNGRKVAIVRDRQGDIREIEAEALLLAIGLQPNSDLLRLQNTGVAVNEHGFVKTNEFMETTEANVWALGDVVGKAPYKHGANYEAQLVFWNMTKPEKEKKFAADYTLMPHAIFTSPQIAGIGLTEQAARAQGFQYKIAKLPYLQTGMGKAIEAKDDFVKFILDAEGVKILGCHIMGPAATILIHEVIVAMTAAAGQVAAITAAIHIHPSLSEVVQRAL